LGTSPGGINFENAPFKLTKEYVELMGGLDSEMFLYFKLLLFKGFIELKNHIE
jgi:phosphatidylinositol 4-kinase